jgi:hypothetical protein
VATNCSTAARGLKETRFFQKLPGNARVILTNAFIKEKVMPPARLLCGACFRLSKNTGSLA